jgi:hypothetical protein
LSIREPLTAQVRLLPAAMPTTARRDAIQRAVEDRNRAAPQQRLPRSAARLLLTMFPAEDVFSGPQELLRSAGGTRVAAVLAALVATGLLERRRSTTRGPDSYRLMLS